MGDKPSFKAVVFQRFSSAICYQGRQASVRHFDDLFPSSPLGPSERCSVINDHIGRIHPESVGETRIRFFAEYHGEIVVSGRSNIIYHTHLLMTCWVSLDNGLRDFEITEIGPYDEPPKLKRPLNDQLVPVIRKAEYDDYATDLLKAYYPEALKRICRVDADELLRRMDLKCVRECITNDASIFGAMIFRPCLLQTFSLQGYEDEVYRFETGDVIVDPRVFALYTDGAENNTKIHEATHWFFDRKAFELASIFDESENRFECPVDDEDLNDWKEYHANKLPAHILMPRDQFIQKAQKVIDSLVKERKPNNVVDVMADAICELAEFYEVSKLSVKLRLMDLKCHYAFGVFDYRDGNYVKAFAVSKEAAKKNITYSISSEDFLEELETNEEFRGLLESGRFVFVENHICLKKDKYIIRQGSGYSLTDYGRYHVDECCIPCTTVFYREYEYQHPGVLFAGTGSKWSFNIKPFIENVDDSKVEEELNDFDSEMMPVYENMPRTFCPALQYLMDWRELNETGLAEGSSLDPRVIRYILDGERVSKDNLVLICNALNLPGIIALRLCEMSPGERIDAMNPMDQRYVNLIMYGQNIPIGRLKKLLPKRNHKRD